jgi:hypothetical protein
MIHRQVPHQASVRQATAAASRFGIGTIAPFFNEAKPKLLKTQTFLEVVFQDLCPNLGPLGKWVIHLVVFGISPIIHIYIYIMGLYIYYAYNDYFLKGLQSGPPLQLIKVLIQGSLLLRSALMNLLISTNPPPGHNKWYFSHPPRLIS